MKQLTHLRGGRKIAEYLLDLPDVVVGRGRSAHVRLDDNPMASRQHCVVRERSEAPGQHVVEDLGGANGTFVNVGKVDLHTLRPGDRIVLGEDTLRYDFATRLAVSLRPAPPPSTLEQKVFGAEPAEEPGGVEELDLAAVSELGDLSDLRKAKAQPPPSPPPMALGGSGFAEQTAIAGRGELDRLLADAMQKAKPHLVQVGDEEKILPLTESPTTLGHRDDCDIRLPGLKLLGRLAGEFVREGGGWCVVPRSPFWTPLRLGDSRLVKIRRLDDGDVVAVGGLQFRYSKGEPF